MQSGLVSVIVPVYNIEPYLSECVESILRQTYRSLQILLVDDGSTDGCPSLCDRFAEEDSCVKVIHRDNGGLSAARNTGLDASKGEFVVFVDGDDWIDSDIIERAVAAAEKNQADAVMWSYMREYGNRSLPKFTYGTEETLCVGEECRELFRRMVGPLDEETAKPQNLDVLSSVCTKLYRRGALEGIRFLPTSVIGTEDTLFNLTFFSAVRRVYYLPVCAYHYRKNNATSITHSYSADFLERRLNFFRCVSELTEPLSDDRLRQAHQNRRAIDLLGVGLNICRKNNLSTREKREELLKALSTPEYGGAAAAFDSRYMAPQWRMYYRFAKKRNVRMMVRMCSAIQFVRSRM